MPQSVVLTAEGLEILQLMPATPRDWNDVVNVEKLPIAAPLP